MSHLKKVFIDNESFNMYTGTMIDEPHDNSDDDHAMTESVSKKLKRINPKMKLMLDKVNVSNLNENANLLINTLHVNQPLPESQLGDAKGRKGKTKRPGLDYIDPIDYTKCLTHQKELIYMDKERYEFYCVDCITDINIKIVQSNLIKIRRDQVQIKELGRMATTQLAKLKNRVEINQRLIGQRLSLNQKLKMETKSIVTTRLQQVYLELKTLEARVSTLLETEIDVDIKELKRLQYKHDRLYGMLVSGGFEINMNQTKDFSDIVASINKWRYMTTQFTFDELLDHRIDWSFEERFK